MRWTRGHTSPDVIDRRGASGGFGGFGGGRGGGGLALLPLAFSLIRRLGIVGVLIVAAGLGVLYFMNRSGGGSPQRFSDDRSAPATAAPTEAVQFVSFVLDDVQQTWAQKFSERGQTYQKAQLVLFSDRTSTGCGHGDAASGPFYCPLDSRAYIDLSFYRELEQRFGARGDFAQAYVLAHEIGHHVQNILGTSDRVHRASASAQRGPEGLSVRLELQADCYAGVWAHSTGRRELLEEGDIDEALRAASAIGDDRLQKQATGTVSPETFTHGSSEQRSRWFRKGYEQGNPDACNTFETRSL